MDSFKGVHHGEHWNGDEHASSPLPHVLVNSSTMGCALSWPREGAAIATVGDGNFGVNVPGYTDHNR